MGTCKKKIILGIIFTIIFTTHSYTDINFKSFKDKKVSYLDFFLLKFESKLNKRTQILRKQFFATRVQYSNLIVSVDYNNNDKKILIDFYAIMDRQRYAKKNMIKK